MRNSILLVLAFLLITFKTTAQTKNFIDQPYIEVTGSSDTLITPNQIFLKIILSEKDTRDKVSIEAIENKMITALKTLGINTEVDLTTSDILSNYRFYLLKQKDILKSKEYILKVSDAATASKVFMLLEELGISNTSIDRVDHSDLDNIINIAKAKSIQNARTKAISLTRAIGQTIGSAIHISDIETNPRNQLAGKVTGIMIRGNKTLSQDGYETPKIEFEKIKVTASVSIKFILK